MDGLFLRALVPSYRSLRRIDGLDALCIQEHMPLAGASIARALSGAGRYQVVWNHRAPRLAILYDRFRLRLRRRGAGQRRDALLGGGDGVGGRVVGHLRCFRLILALQAQGLGLVHEREQVFGALVAQKKPWNLRERRQRV